MGGAPISPDFAKADPKRVTVLFENDRVRILRVVLGSFDRTEPHVHPRGVGLFLTDFDLENIDHAGRRDESRGLAGDYRWYDPVLHTTKNLSSREMRLLMIELKH